VAPRTKKPARKTAVRAPKPEPDAWHDRRRVPALNKRALIRFLFIAALWISIPIGLVLVYYAATLPDPRQVVALKRKPSITFLAADGSLITRYGELYGTTVSVAQLPKYVPEAVIATEDQRFYHHFGIDPIGLMRAAFVNWRAHALVQGGSTITQQLAKNLFLTPERTMGRKIQEALLALWIERLYTKDQILTGYLNRVYFGAGAYGIDAAARTYFGKPATELTLREAAVLAGCLKAPSHYSPTGNANASLERTRIVLERMHDAGYITDAQMQDLSDTPPLPPKKPGSGESYRYFTDYVADHIDDFIGHTERDIVVETTYEPAVQRSAEHWLETVLESPQATGAHASQGAVVTLAHDGAIRAMVGGRDYEQSQFNRAAQALRQPGSSFKPVYYLAALQNGMTPDSMVEDAPITIGDYSPENFEPGYRGEITMREALAYSINTAAVRVLQSVGIDRARAMAKRLGITEDLERNYSLALGTSEVPLIEMAEVYNTFANDGQRQIPYAIATIKDRDGTVLYRREASGAGGEAALPWHVEQLNSMLESVIDYGTGKGAKLDRPCAGKTGTSQDYRDAWFLGFTGDYTTGVWVGNDDDSPMHKITGGSLPVAIWRAVMTDAERGRPAGPIPVPGAMNSAAPEEAGAVPAPSSDSGDAYSPAAAASAKPQGDALPGNVSMGDTFSKLINGLTSK
jgi:penicillin-binding protein 1A